FPLRIPVVFLALCAALWSLSATASELRQIILLQDEASTKAFIDLSQQSQYKAFMLQSPTRAVIDIDGANLSPEFKLPGSNGLVLSVRQGKTPTGIRLVLDLANSASLNSSWDNTTGASRLLIELQQQGGGNAVAAQAVKQSAPVPATSPVPSAPAKPDAPSIESIALAPAPAVAEKTIKVTPGKPVPVGVPGKSNVGYALMDDEIVQIDIDSSGTSPKTTIQKAAATQNPKTPSLPNNKQIINPGPAQPLPKKSKTVNDVLGSSARKLVIAIDAGHGGKDPGALGGNGLREKEVTLRVAKELAAMINADPGMKAVLIRDDDTFVPLAERYQRARRAQADLFVSIHADAAENNAASGSSVYVLSTKGASSQAARWLADKENAADLIGEGGSRVSLDDKERNLSLTLLDMTQNNTMRVSEDAAGNVLQSLKDLGKAHKKEVEHANFVVLRSPDVPSMLIETGFITNAAEERKLADPEHRKRLAFAIAQGLRRFFIEQPLQGTYYARKQNGQGAGINAASGIIP
ncbi:MAG: N-acetylmuramoyl-L-alanine amidase, partial [Arenimonas sp.]|nr:N-acetylmuramoyl-L-alanine amidase [Arenimonas sp.]